MAALKLKSADAALDYACALHKDSGHSRVGIRVGIHTGPIQVVENGTYGGTVNFAARAGAIDLKDADIRMSDAAKGQIDQIRASRQGHLQWLEHAGVEGV